MKNIHKIIFPFCLIVTLACGFLLYIAKDANFKLASFEAEGVCLNVPLNDKDYAEYLANIGDPEGIFVHAAFKFEALYPELEKIRSATVRNQHSSMRSFKRSHFAKQKYELMNKEVFPILLKGARIGDVRSKSALCGMYIDLHDNGYKDDQALYWCKQAAEHHDYRSQIGLIRLYTLDGGIEKNAEEIYYWHVRSMRTRYKTLTIDIKTDDEEKYGLSREEMEKIIKRANSITANIKNQESGSLSFPSEFERAIREFSHVNILGLSCGGQSKRCVKEDQCGNLEAYYCHREKLEYLILNKSEQKIVSACNWNDGDCMDFVPEEWTCGEPDGMPISKKVRKKLLENPEAWYRPRQKTRVLHCDQMIARDMAFGEPSFFNLKTFEKVDKYCERHCHPPKTYNCSPPFGVPYYGRW